MLSQARSLWWECLSSVPLGPHLLPLQLSRPLFGSAWCQLCASFWNPSQQPKAFTASYLLARARPLPSSCLVNRCDRSYSGSPPWAPRWSLVLPPLAWCSSMCVQCFSNSAILFCCSYVLYFIVATPPHHMKSPSQVSKCTAQNRQPQTHHCAMDLQGTPTLCDCNSMHVTAPRFPSPCPWKPLLCLFLWV